MPDWLSEHRDLYKKTFNQLLNGSKTTRSPGQWRRLAPDITPSQKPDNWDELKDNQKRSILRELFIELTGRDYDELIRALLKKHEPVEHHFFFKSWSWLQRIDSDIAEKVIIDLIEKHDEVILPIHDSFIVKIDAEKKPYEILLNLMEVAFEELLRVKPAIDRNTPENKEAPKEAVARMMKIIKNYQETHKGYMRRDKEWDDLKKNQGR